MTVIINKGKFNLRETLNSLRLKTGLKGLEILKSNTVDDVYNVIGTNRNLLINGDMQINQRGAASYTTDSTYTLDRWRVGRYSSDHVEISRQSSGLAEFPYCVRIQNPSGQTSDFTNEIHLNQVLESINSAKYKNKPLTISFWARVANTSGISPSMGVTLFFGSGTDNYADYNYFASNSITGFDKIFTLSTNWQKYTFTATAPALTNQIGVALFKVNNTLTAVANDYIEVTGVQLEAGTVATPFEHRPYATELQLCQRYFEIVDVRSSLVMNINASEAGRQLINYETKRATPTIGFGFSSISNYQFYGNANTSMSSAPLTAKTSLIYHNGFNSWTPSTGGCVYAYSTNNGSFDITVSAEL